MADATAITNDAKFLSHDVHARVIEDTRARSSALLASLDSSRPLADIDDRMRQILDSFEQESLGFDTFETVEQLRLAVLPWHNGNPTYQAGVDNSFVITDLAATLLMARTPLIGAKRYPTASSIVSKVVGMMSDLLDLGLLRATLVVDRSEPIALMQTKAQATEVAVRATSFPDMTESTVRALLTEPYIEDNLVSLLGFTAGAAIDVLKRLHHLQVENLNKRLQEAHRVTTSQARFELVASTTSATSLANRAMFNAMAPSSASVTVSAREIALSVGMSESTVTTVLETFAYEPEADELLFDTATTFLGGDNPLRDSPVLRTRSGRAMTSNPTLLENAVRLKCEAVLQKAGGKLWEKYQYHRGQFLELRTRDALKRLLPTADFRDEVQYFVPKDASEAQLTPENYSKRVEGDHLIILDDVAIVVEDKAVAFSTVARAGTITRLRRDLVGIVRKASDQAERLASRIRDDGGLRLKGEGWLDLSHVREIHSIAVSLDDLSSISTATAELIEAGLVSREFVPWTVSLHDLQLIAELSEHPADFLLYLRRRRHPRATVLYTAPDELDLFMYYWERGLQVNENPADLRQRYPSLPEASEKEHAAWAKQKPGFITSRTDALDAWYLENVAPKQQGSLRLASSNAKPERSACPVDDLVSRIDQIGTFGQYSIDATLWSGDLATQKNYASHGPLLARKTKREKRDHTHTVLVPTLEDGGWLLIWHSQVGPITSRDVDALVPFAHAKGSALGVRRAAILVFDEHSQLQGVSYTLTPNDMTVEEKEILAALEKEEASGQGRSRSPRGQRQQPKRQRRKQR